MICNRMALDCKLVGPVISTYKFGCSHLNMKGGGGGGGQGLILPHQKYPSSWFPRLVSHPKNLVAIISKLQGLLKCEVFSPFCSVYLCLE